MCWLCQSFSVCCSLKFFTFSVFASHSPLGGFVARPLPHKGSQRLLRVRACSPANVQLQTQPWWRRTPRPTQICVTPVRQSYSGESCTARVQLSFSSPTLFEMVVLCLRFQKTRTFGAILSLFRCRWRQKFSAYKCSARMPREAGRPFKFQVLAVIWKLPPFYALAFLPLNFSHRRDGPILLSEWVFSVIWMQIIAREHTFLAGILYCWCITSPHICMHSHY